MKTSELLLCDVADAIAELARANANDIKGKRASPEAISHVVALHRRNVFLINALPVAMFLEKVDKPLEPVDLVDLNRLDAAFQEASFKHGTHFHAISQGLRGELMAIPGYNERAVGRQLPSALNHHRRLVSGAKRLLGAMEISGTA